MIKAEVIIVGGGPAGSTCAWQLNRSGIDSIVLDKKRFPRTKLCAGWITPKVLQQLEIDISDYPHRFLTFPGLHITVKGFRFKAPTKQHSIRRYEFDHWLLQRSKAKVYKHEAKIIKQTTVGYIIDDKFSCKYLVGAGGTNCPVYKTFFKELNPRAKKNLIVTREQEFDYDFIDDRCYLWFLENELTGYSWYVPKQNGYLNIGIGGKETDLKEKNKSIKWHWELFAKKLEDLGLVKNDFFNPKGYSYYLRNGVTKVEHANAFIVGDAAGLATVDIGEGIGPAVESGLLAAEAIMYHKPYSVDSISKYSIKYRFPTKVLELILKIKNKRFS